MSCCTEGHRVKEIIMNQPLGTIRINNKFHVNLINSRHYIYVWWEGGVSSIDPNFIFFAISFSLSSCCCSMWISQCSQPMCGKQGEHASNMTGWVFRLLWGQNLLILVSNFTAGLTMKRVGVCLIGCVTLWCHRLAELPLLLCSKTWWWTGTTPDQPGERHTYIHEEKLNFE